MSLEPNAQWGWIVKGLGGAVELIERLHEAGAECGNTHWDNLLDYSARLLAVCGNSTDNRLKQFKSSQRAIERDFFPPRNPYPEGTTPEQVALARDFPTTNVRVELTDEEDKIEAVIPSPDDF